MRAEGLVQGVIRNRPLQRNPKMKLLKGTLREP